MSWLKRQGNKLSRWVRRKAHWLIDESEAILARLPDKERSLFLNWLRLRIIRWGLTYAGGNLGGDLGRVMETLDDGQKEAVNSYLRELYTDILHA